jgi:hypothetical protein
MMIAVPNYLLYLLAALAILLAWRGSRKIL